MRAYSSGPFCGCCASRLLRVARGRFFDLPPARPVSYRLSLYGCMGGVPRVLRGSKGVAFYGNLFGPRAIVLI